MNQPTPADKRAVAYPKKGWLVRWRHPSGEVFKEEVYRFRWRAEWRADWARAWGNNLNAGRGHYGWLFRGTDPWLVEVLRLPLDNDGGGSDG